MDVGNTEDQAPKKLKFSKPDPTQKEVNNLLEVPGCLTWPGKKWMSAKVFEVLGLNGRTPSLSLLLFCVLKNIH